MENLVGKTFGRWTVLELWPERSKDGHVLWLCQCSCEQKTIRPVLGKSLRNGKSLSCGCLRRERASVANQGNNYGSANTQDIANQKFNHLTALYKLPTHKNNSWEWQCRCDCGALTVATVRDLRSSRKTRCEKCALTKTISKGEEKIIDILQQNNIEYEYQKSFEDCYFDDTNKLAVFDFYIPGQNYLIEYDGEQHFHLSETSAWKEKEERIRYKDSAKNNWCKENNIPIIRIPYTHFNKLCLEDLLLETSTFIVANK